MASTVCWRLPEPTAIEPVVFRQTHLVWLIMQCYAGAQRGLLVKPIPVLRETSPGERTAPPRPYEKSRDGTIASMDLVTHFRCMARNNAWSNWRLLKACSRLSPEEFGATRTSFFPSIQATLDHILLVDLYYLDALEGGRLGYPHFSCRQPLQDFAVIRTDQIATDQRLIGFCDRLTEVELSRVVSIDRGPKGMDQETVADTLSHLFVHQIHHRGQVHAMLAGTTIKPPQLDEYFLQYDAALRAPDLAALGLEGPEQLK